MCDPEGCLSSLYNSAISTIVTFFSKFKVDIKVVPDSVLFDVYHRLHKKGRLCDLAQELSDLDTLIRLLRVVDKRHLLHGCFQAVMDHGQKLSVTLTDAYRGLCSNMTQPPDSGGGGDVSGDKIVHLGFNLGGFLSDAGWFFEAERIYMCCLEICKHRSVRDGDNVTYLRQCLDCYARLMHVQNSNCKYKESQQTWQHIQYYTDRLGSDYNRAVVYKENCSLLFAQSLYDQAYHYGNLALQEVSRNPSSTPAKATVDIFRQCSKACVVKREFKKAEILIKFAVQHAREHFGEHHFKYSDALLDYGFFLLNVDYISQAVNVYQAALDIRLSVFGGKNLHVAVAHEDLAYSSYVNEYSSGKFDAAKEHAETSITMVTAILPQEHLALASSKRVKALILEEVAIDSHNDCTEKALLNEAHDLHLASLALAMKAFGENNVQTAKHYGNLGRLYQSMHQYKEAEEMHLKSIAIKERLLGKEDYEVALSVGHLASLYNYDMCQYEKAEKLYLRSIEIGRQLFGAGYSGLEYDYRGLRELYQAKHDQDNVEKYNTILAEWSQVRDCNQRQKMKPLEIPPHDNVSQALCLFFKTE